jgi:hypothetical protein
MKNMNASNAMKLTLCAGVLTMASLASQGHAQSADALIDKLVEKGILTVNEASDLRDQADKDFKTAFQAKTGMPDWVTGYKFSGDVRGRFEQFSSDNNLLIDRTRYRYRVRVGLTVNMMDHLEAGLRLSSADAKGIGSQSSAGNALSGNSTMQDNFTKKGIYIDAAYGKWTPLNAGNWLLSATVGKMDNPFLFTPMVFDPDLTPEGAALTGGYTINDQHSLAFVGGAFVTDEEQNSTHDPFMYGGQVLWNAKWSEKWASTVGLGALAIVNPEQLTTANVPYINQGNTRDYVPYYPPGATTPTYLNTLTYNYTPWVVDASVTYTADTFPFYTGAFPIKFAGEFMNNPGAPKDNNGYWFGVTFGKSGTKKTWDLTYRYEYLEADAWYDQLTDDDNGAFYATTAYPSLSASGQAIGQAAGYYGGTNVKGHLVRLSYSFTDSCTFVAACFINNLINLPQQTGYLPNGQPGNVDLNSSAIHFMADVMWKF